MVRGVSFQSKKSDLGWLLEAQWLFLKLLSNQHNTSLTTLHKMAFSDVHISSNWILNVHVAAFPIKCPTKKNTVDSQRGKILVVLRIFVAYYLLPLTDISVLCRKASVCLSKTDWKWTLPTKNALGWHQVCSKFYINRYFILNHYYLFNMCYYLLKHPIFLYKFKFKKIYIFELITREQSVSSCASFLCFQTFLKLSSSENLLKLGSICCVTN